MAEELYGKTPGEYDALTRQNAQKAYDSLQQQYDAAQGGVGVAEKGLAALGTAEKGAMGDVANQSALAFTQSQARGGGGSLAGMRQAGLARGVAEGSVRGEYAQRQAQQEGAVQQARANAAKAAGEFATEGQKLNLAAQAYGAGATPGYDAAKAIFDAYMDQNAPVFATDADREGAIAEIQRKMDVEPNPTKKQGMAQAIADIRANKINASGAFDTADQSRSTWKKILDPFGLF